MPSLTNQPQSKIKTIKAGSNLIYQTIYNQAGSIEKALLEYIMNSIDAKATYINITIDNNGVDYSILDNGDGFGDASYTTEEKEKCIDAVFGHLGFDHGTDEENGRVYGRFGIGRAQLWAFSKNTWHTHNMTMEVDIKFKGLVYNIQETETFVDGCKIEGQFYDKLTLNNILLIKKVLSTLSAYAPIQVFFNEQRINKSIDDVKDSLGIKGIRANLKPGIYLSIYNQGVYVREYPPYLFGTGGVICSEVGYPFEVNAARNDILQSRCKLWKKLKKVLDIKTEHDVKKKVMTDDLRKAILSKIASGDFGEDYSYIKKPLIKMINNRYTSVSALFTEKFSIAQRRDDSLAERIHQNGLAKVLLEEFTSSLGIDAYDVVETLKMVQKQTTHQKPSVVYIDLEKLKRTIPLEQDVIAKKDLTKRQVIFLEAINSKALQQYLMHYRVRHDGRVRKIFIGKSEIANAWTDGVSYIVLNKNLVRGVDRGAGGIFAVLNTLIHEYCHDEDNQDLHSFDFYKSYHDQSIFQAGFTFCAFTMFIKRYTSRLIKNDFVINQSLSRSLDVFSSVANK